MSTTPTRGRLPVARRDRRPLLASLAVLLILLGSLATALIVYRADQREPVLVATRDIPFGKVMESSDFQIVRMSADGGIAIPDANRDQFIGTHATTAIPRGALVHPKMFSIANPVPAGGEVVGLVLDPSRMPSNTPEPGQVVRIYFVAGSGSGGQATLSPGDEIVKAARVLSVGGGAGGGTISLSVLVKADAAGQLADFAAGGNVAVTMLPDDTTPTIDHVAPAE